MHSVKDGIKPQYLKKAGFFYIKKVHLNDYRYMFKKQQAAIEAAAKAQFDKLKADLLQDPIIAAGMELKEKQLQTEKERNQVLDAGFTERVLRQLVQEAQYLGTVATIRFPLKEDGTGGQVIEIRKKDYDTDAKNDIFQW
jgi:hypothetical protein